MAEFFPFKFYDELRSKCIRARYVAERHVIAERYEKWEIVGPPEIRGDLPVHMFAVPSPCRE